MTPDPATNRFFAEDANGNAGGIYGVYDIENRLLIGGTVLYRYAMTLPLEITGAFTASSDNNAVRGEPIFASRRVIMISTELL